MTVLRSALVLALLLGPSWGQLNNGEIGVSGFSTSQFSVLDSGGVPTSFNIGSFLGTGTSQSILWDPAVPDSFLVGGFGFVGRVTIAGATATYALITNGSGDAAQMSFDAAGQLIVADAATDQIRSVDPLTGTVTSVTTGAQPWGASVNAAAVDPTNGDIYVGGNNAMFRIPFGSTVPVPFVSAWATGTSFVSGIAFDPFDPNAVWASFLTVNRIVRIDKVTGTITDLLVGSTITGPNSLAPDQNGDIIVGAAAGAVFRIPNAGGAGVLVGTATGQGTSASGVTVVGAASAGFSLAVTPSGLGGGSLAISNIPASTVEGYTVLSFDTSLPLGTGSAFGLNPDATAIALVTLAPFAIPGNPIHWTYPAPGLYPENPFNIPPTVLPAGVPMDFLAIAVDSFFGVTAAPVVRVTF